MFINKKKKETELKFNPNNNWPLNNWVQGVGVQGEMIIFCGVQVWLLKAPVNQVQALILTLPAAPAPLN